MHFKGLLLKRIRDGIACEQKLELGARGICSCKCFLLTQAVDPKLHTERTDWKD